jgi:outer membrane biosynthesis protein TonB
MRSGIIISAVAHVLFLAWGVLSFTSRPLNSAPTESMPVDVISTTELSQMSAGIKNAPKVEAPKPLVEKIGDNNPAKEAPKVTEKQEIQSASAEPTPPKEAPPKPEAKPDKPDPIAEALKKEPPKPQPPKKPQPKLDLSKVENALALVDKREQRRHAATGASLNNTPSLGASTGNAVSLSQSELDRLRARLKENWNVPAGVVDAKELAVVIRFELNRDGSLKGAPVVVNRGSHPVFQVAAEYALRAVINGAPYTFLSQATYDAWRDLEVNFDSRLMYGG